VLWPSSRRRPGRADGRAAHALAVHGVRGRRRAHLLASWHPSTRPDDLVLDDVEWRGLTVLDAVAGGPWDDEGVVEFVARYRAQTRRGRVHERSTFVRERGRWLYVDGS